MSGTELCYLPAGLMAAVIRPAEAVQPKVNRCTCMHCGADVFRAAMAFGPAQGQLYRRPDARPKL